MALELLKQEIKNVCENYINEDELNKAKKKLKVNFAEEMETVSDIGEVIGHCITVYENISCHAQYLHILETIGLDDVLKAAKKYLDLNKTSISVLVPDK